MAKAKILITVKTYPSLSEKYDELVCTAGFHENGSWIRIYPIPFRKLDYDQQYRKYQWIELDLIKNSSDPRTESYRPTKYTDLLLLDFIDTDNGKWTKRKDLIANSKIYSNLNTLITEARNKGTSLATFKPTEILDFTIKSVPREWDKTKLESIRKKAKQIDIFLGGENPFEVVKKLPYKFSYKFKDDTGKISELMIEDWEIGSLYWNCLEKADGNEKIATQKVKDKYLSDFARIKDLYLFLGTTRSRHYTSPNPFIIIGTFHPPKDHQLKLPL